MRFYDTLKTFYRPEPSAHPPASLQMGINCWLRRSRSWRDMAVRWSGSQPPCSNRWRGHKWRSKRTLISCPQKKKSESHRKKKPWCGKASGPDAIHAEVYKAGGAIIMQKLAELFQFTWNEGKVPQQLKDADIVHIYKRKGNRQSCHNHWIFLSYSLIAGKILARILLNRLIQHLAGSPTRKPVWFPLTTSNCMPTWYSPHSSSRRIDGSSIATSLGPSLIWPRPSIRCEETSCRR